MTSITLRKFRRTQPCSIISVLIMFLIEAEAVEWIVDSNISYAFAIQQITFGDTITLQEGIYSGEESCDKTITVSNVTMQASLNRSVVIDCKMTSRHIKITGDDVKVQGISFINGFSMASGGCLAIKGKNAVIENCSFDSCNSSGFGGGLILENTAGNATINQVKILRCSAFRGGAIFVNTSARLILSESFVFSENMATSSGGALYLDVGSTGIINAVNGDMNGNTARLSGGAIHLGKADLTISGTVSFLNNTVTFQTLSSAGGAIYGITSSLTVASRGSVIFRGNSCVYVGGALALYTGSKIRIGGDVRFRGG